MTCHPSEWSRSVDPSNPLAAGVALDYSSRFQGAKFCITHKPSMLVNPLDLLVLPLQHHHVPSLSILAPSSTIFFEFHQYFTLKITFMALYVAIFRTTMYVHGYHGIFRVYPALYAEKDPISAWAETHILGWPKQKI